MNACAVASALLGFLISAGAAMQAPPTRDSGGCRPLDAAGDAPMRGQEIVILGQRVRRIDDVCYAEGESWIEPDVVGDYDVPPDEPTVRLYQRFDLYRLASGEAREPLPLVIWAHPAGSDETLGDAGVRDKVLPALRQGFAFMSVEFRHPRNSQPAYPREPLPSLMVNTDIGRAVQWVRGHAARLGVDPQNVFLLGQSRGALALFTAVADDFADPDAASAYLRESSKPQGVFVTQAQSSYEHRDLKKMLMRRSTVPIPPGGDQAFDYRAYFEEVDAGYVRRRLGSVVGELDAADPPAWLRFDRTPPRGLLGAFVASPGADPLADGRCYEPAYGRYSGPGWSFDSGVACLDEHHPSFGREIALAYRALGRQPGAAVARASEVQFGPPPPQGAAMDREAWTAWLAAIGAQFFDDYVCFFVDHLTDAAAGRRSRAIDERAAAECRDAPYRTWPDGSRLPAGTAGAARGTRAGALRGFGAEASACMHCGRASPADHGP